RAEEIIFVRGTTEAINLVAQTYGRTRVRAGDEVLITEMEHHSDIVPWQLLCEEKGAVLRVAPIDDDGQLLVDELQRMLGPRTRLLALAHVSNTLGTINPVRRIVEIAHRQGVPVLLDGAQAVPHFPIDVRALDCDFYAFSGHKLFGPTGIGVLYGKSELLEEMPPWQGGGDMIRSVTFETTSAPPNTAPNPSGTAWVCRPQPELGTRSTTAVRTWTRSSRAITRSRRSAGEPRVARPVPGGRHRPQPQAAQLPQAGGGQPE